MDDAHHLCLDPFIWIAVTVFIDIFRRRDLSGWAKAAWVVLIDVFRRHDISGWAKAAWVIFIVILPWIGVLAYLIVNHTGMNERRAKEAQAAQSQFDDYVRQTAGKGGGAASEIEKAKQLLDDGTISQAEFDSIKAKALG